jgi:glucose-1-phosphate adenylyltransferase
VTLPRVLVLVLAGGAGSRLELLTERRAKPAVPFGGVYRLVDFPLTNCQHSQLADVWITLQFHPASLAEHLANGRPWDLDRTRGGLTTLPPYRGSEREGWHEGTADALWRNAEQGDDGRVTGYAYKPDEPATDVVANEVFVFSPDPVLQRLEDLAAEAGENGLQDLGTRLLPELVDDGSVRAHPLEGYWRDLGTVEAYWQAHRDFLSAEPPFALDDPAWPINTRGGHATAIVASGADVENCILAGGARVAGTVRRSVLAPGVVVEAGATVTDSVLLPGVRVEGGATVTRAVLDDEVVVADGVTVGATGEEDGITLVGRGARVEVGTTIAAGDRYPKPEDR